MATTFRLWVFGCPHTTTDKRRSRESLGLAIQHSESPAFGGWDAAIGLGDYCGSATPIKDDGVEVLKQKGRLTAHPIEAIYDVGGNHDKEGPGEPYGWFVDRILDPMCQHTALSGMDASRRPYPTTGTWERYTWQVGNINFAMMSDVVVPGLSARGCMGGNPGGAVTQETFDWWADLCASKRAGAELVVTAAHYGPKNTTICTGDYEGGTIDPASGRYIGEYHGPGLDPKGSGRLFYVGDGVDSDAFTAHLAAHNADTALWLLAHSHARPGTTVNGRGLRANVHGCEFVNCAALTLHHGAAKHQYPRSRVFTFTDGSAVVAFQNWYHDKKFNGAVGFAGGGSITLPKTVEL